MQQGLMRSEQAPASLLSGVLARLEQRQALASEHSIDVLRVHLDHAQWDIRAAAIHALGKSIVSAGQHTDTIREMLLLALQDKHRLVRVAAIRVLSQLGEDVPIDMLLFCLRDPDWEVREMAVLVLLQYPQADRKNGKNLMLPLAPPDINNSSRTMSNVPSGFALGKLGNLHLDLLQALLKVAQQDTHSSVREAAAYALQIYHNEEVNVVQKIELARTDAIVAKQGVFRSLSLTRCLHIFIRQIALIHKSVWFVPPLFLILWFVQNAYLLNGAARNIHQAGLYLALFSTISAGAGSVFLYGAERDAAFELTLSTPTSLRLLMLCRFVLVVGYNILLVGSVSAATVAFYGGSLWDIVQLWLGPVLLISSLSLMLSMLVGSLLALSIAFLLEASQSFVFGLFGNTPMLTFSFSNNWQTSPMFVLVALLMLAVALFYAPRQPRFATV